MLRSITSMRLWPRSAADAAQSAPRADRSRSRQRAGRSRGCMTELSRRCKRPQRAPVRSPHSALRVWARNSLGGKSAGTCVHCAQLTQMRVNGLGIRKRSQDRMVQARSRLQMKCADGRARHLRQLDGAHLGLIDRAARPVGGEDRRRADSMTCFRPSSPSRAPRELEPRTASKPNSLRMRVISSPSKLRLMRMVAPDRRK